MSVVIVWRVFRDTAVDYRLVLTGVLAPDLVDAITGAGVMHTVWASGVLLVGVMAATLGRRALRRRLLALPVGTFLHLLLDGAWAVPALFWWPVLGWSAGADVPLSVHRPVAVLVLQEAAGLAALAWWWRRFHLGEPERRRTFVRTGRLGRDLVA